MSNARLDKGWSFHGLKAVILQNSFLRAVVLPEVGARIYRLIYKPRDQGLLWNHPRIAPAKVPFGARYDDVWCGGWDELFPNNQECEINGEIFPDHGETWAVEWDWQAAESADEVSVTFYCRTRISDVAVRKTILLRSGEPRLRVAYVLENKSSVRIPMLWNLHVAMSVSENHRIEFPPMKVRAEPDYPGSLLGAPDESTWPMIATSSGPVDLRRVPPLSNPKLHFFYGVDLQEGWCGVTDTASRLAYGLAFDPSIFQSCWLFGSFGLWRNLQVAVLEPSTGYPFNLNQAVRDGTCGWLEAQQRIETSVVFSVAENLSGISAITHEGEIL